MKKKIPKAELEEALNDLEVSEDAKKAFASGLRSRNEPLFFGQAAKVLGIIMIVGYFMSVFRYQELKEQGRSIFLILTQLYVGIFFLAYGSNRIRSVKLQKATVELIMKNKK